MHRSKLCILIVVLIVTFGMTTAATAEFGVFGNPSHEARPKFVPDEILVKLRPGGDVSSFKKVHGLAHIKKSKHIQNVHTFRIPKGWTVNGMVEKLKGNPNIEYVQPVHYVYADLNPTDPYLDPYQWHISRINCEGAWDHSTGNGVIVAIIDTGVDHRHPDLAGTSFTAGWDFVGNKPYTYDTRHPHGTHVAGTVAQTTNNGIGCAGVAPGAAIMPIRVLDNNGSGTDIDVADGITFAANNGAKVLNLSLGGPQYSSVLEGACNYAYGMGCVIVCAAGNEGTYAPHYPAAYDVCISVSATNYLDNLASYSNYGSTIDIAAPGGDVGDQNGDGYQDYALQGAFEDSWSRRSIVRSYGYYFMLGTSMASPHVAGVAALVWSVNPNFTNDDIRCALELTATDLGDPGWDEYFGHGLVDALAALESGGCDGPCSDTDSDGICDDEDNCPNEANEDQADADEDGAGDVCDGCPDDPDKTEPGVCGCGVADTDSDEDGTADCIDGCPNDPAKTEPGICGCGAADTDSDGDGTADCIDGCPNDPAKTEPGICGCGVVDTDTDSDGDGILDCIDGCPDDPGKTGPGICGCGVVDTNTDSDGDGTADCIDGCPEDPGKTDLGDCGCGIADTDSDGDGTADCIDGCPDDPGKKEPGVCGCGMADTDSDGDGTLDCNDGCPSDPDKTAPGVCGCGMADIDTDGDGPLDCNDGCPSDPDKTAPGVCGCGMADIDTDGDGALDCKDGCPSDPGKTAPGVCGCGVADTDSDEDGFKVCEDCDDNNNTVYPGAEEFCGDGTDQDCDGYDPACCAESGEYCTSNADCCSGKCYRFFRRCR
ncbi:MAG: S8 family serine peptidase [bacterium]